MKSEIEIPIKINVSDLGNIEVRHFQPFELAPLGLELTPELVKALAHNNGLDLPRQVSAKG
jgi:hypothetical protein